MQPQATPTKTCGWKRQDRPPLEPQRGLAAIALIWGLPASGSAEGMRSAVFGGLVCADLLEAASGN